MAKANYGFVKVAVTVPPLKVGNVSYNTAETLKFAKRAVAQGAKLIVFPELGLTGYTAADLFQNRSLLSQCQKAIGEITKASEKINSVLIIGAPLPMGGKLFNSGLVIFGGKVRGVVPKTYIPGYKEFYEERWFAAARDLTADTINLNGQKVPIGTDLLFKLSDQPEAIFGIEICEDLWTPIPPSSFQVLHGANLVINLSASNDLVGKADYRRDLVAQQSARGICGYIYASCGVHESTTDLVFGGHAIIAENGSVLAESKRFQREGELIVSEVDIEHLMLDRERMTSFAEGIHEVPGKKFRTIDLGMKIAPTLDLARRVNPQPFVPSSAIERDKRCQEIFSIQSAGLAKRLEQVQHKNLIIGVSGGLDSTLALLVAIESAGLLGLKSNNIHALTMPGFATTKRTKSNAVKLAEALGAHLDTINISAGSRQQLKDIKHDGKTQDITFQNVQARYRTLTLMDRANQIGGLVVGTGDLSEIALGWNTYTGDHIAHYNVNASIPKTLVKYLVQWASEQEKFKKAKEILEDILNTPISPELVREGKGEISQKTEDLIGPYELHDFFLYHFVRWGSGPKKILFLANQAFAGKYSPTVIKKWLKLFLERFFGSQWKRSVMTDGPKVGSVVLSPRGDWRMPSDADASLWLQELND